MRPTHAEPKHHSFIARGLAGVVLIIAFGLPPATAQNVCDGISPVDHSALESVTVVDGLTGDPLYVTAPPGDRDRIFIVEQVGRILIHQRGAAPTDVTTFLDLTGVVSTVGSEQGLLGLAFDPDYETTGEFYVNYTEGGFQGETVVARYRVSAGDPNVADPNSEERLLTFEQPQTNHNGGHTFFGNDGFLYISSGDGGGGGDQHGACGNGQDTTVLLGKLLRLDVRDADPSSVPADCGAGSPGLYRIPSSNPLNDGVGGECDEIYSYGLRNPWRNALDPATGDLYVADVGQNCWEEINYVAAADVGGNNYGWRQMEGAHCFDPNDQNECDPLPIGCGTSPDCNDPILVDPVLEYGHGEGCSITGGPVYRGCKLPSLDGRYFYGDYCNGFIRSFLIDAGVPTDETDHTEELVPSPDSVLITSFGRDAEGEVYVVDKDGRALKIVPAFSDLEVSGPGAGDPFLLGETTWTWHDLGYETGYPIDVYRVYRGIPGNTFSCIHATTSTSWAGDPAEPNPGEQLAYLVTAVLSDGRESSAGEPSPGVGPRDLSADPCP